MSPRCRHRTLMRVAKKLGAKNVEILYRGKHPALIGQTRRGQRFKVSFSDSPGSRYLDRQVILKLERLLNDHPATDDVRTDVCRTDSCLEKTDAN